MNRLLLLFSLVALPSCLLDDVFAAPGDDVLAVEVPGRLTFATDPGGPWRLAAITTAPPVWSARVKCGDLNPITETDSGTAMLDGQGAFKVMSFSPRPSLKNCAGSGPGGDGSLTLETTAGTVLQASQYSAGSVDRVLLTADGPWSSAVALGTIKCSRRKRDTGAVISPVPCSNGTGGVLAPTTEHIGYSAFDEIDE